MDKVPTTPKAFAFTFDNVQREFETVLACGYRVLTCQEYLAYKAEGCTDRILVNRVDIDFSVEKAERFGDIFKALGVQATFFVRLHAPEYNPFSFDNYRILKQLHEEGHEIGYHSEVVDQEAVWSESAESCLRRDIEIFDKMLGVNIRGVASHGGNTGYNNLDFWKDRKPAMFNLDYEAYDHEPAFNLFQESLYVSDSEWTQWKCYDRGVLCEGDRRSLGDHAQVGAPIIYSLIHPETFQDKLST